MAYRADFWRVCQVCGFQYRSSQTRKRWDGLWVCLPDFEERHPQDFVRGRKDNENVPEPRPEPITTYIGPLSTTLSAAASAGATTLNVELSARMIAADHIGVMLSSGDLHRAINNTIVSASQITLTSATKLPGPASSGALLINYDAVAEAEIG